MTHLTPSASAIAAHAAADDVGDLGERLPIGQSALIIGLTPPARRHASFALQRVMRNLGVGLGGVAGGGKCAQGQSALIIAALSWGLWTGIGLFVRWAIG